jgi:thiol:disulfide interchange protein DsbA
MSGFISRFLVLSAMMFALTGCFKSSDATESEPEVSSKESVTEISTDFKVLSAEDYFADQKGDFVVEFLWLGCSHCQDVETHVSNVKNDYPRVNVIKVPATFNERWKMDAEIYYAATELGMNATELLDYYKTVRLGTNQLPTLDDVRLFVESKGYDQSEFDRLLSSVGVANKLEQADALVKEFNIRGTPTFVTNGKDIVSSEGVSGYEGLVRKVFSDF